MPERPKLGELLVMAGAIDQTQLGAALADQRQYGRPLGITLVRMGFLDEETLVRTFEEPRATAQQLGKEIQQTFKEISGEPESPQGEQLRSPFVFPHRPRREDNDSVGREH